jgi:hypothetical protein
MRTSAIRAAAAAAVFTLAATTCGDDSTAEVGTEPTPEVGEDRTADIGDDPTAAAADDDAEELDDADDEERDDGAVRTDEGDTPDESPSTPATTDPAAGTVIELVVVGNELEGGARRESAPLGTEVTIRVSGDSDDEVHVHGYDVSVDLVDGAGELTFPALIPGVFEIELEEAGTLLVQLEVS